MIEGVAQGNALSSFLFAVSIQPLLNHIADNHIGVQVVAVCDDVQLVGKPHDCKQALEDLMDECKNEGIVINLQKTRILHDLQQSDEDKETVLLFPPQITRIQGAMITLGAP